MKRQGLLFALLFTATVSLAAQGPAPAGLSSRPLPVQPHASAVVARSGGMTSSERGALYGALVGLIAGVVISAHYDEKSFSSMATAGIVMAIPVSLIGALIGMMRN